MAKYRLVLKDSKEDSDWYNLMMETVEQSRHFRKGLTFKLDEQDKMYLEKYYPDYSFQTVNLKEVIEKNNLDNPNHGMFGRRVERWGEYPELYWYSKNKAQERLNPIRLTADLKIMDGNHRLYALYNMGYKNAEVLVLKDTSIKDSDFDYGTGEVNGKDIFDLSTTGMTGSWEDLLLGRDTDYYKNKKNLKGRIVQMSPKEYYEKCAKMFRTSQGTATTPESLKQQRRIDNGKDYMDKLKDVILKKKKKFPTCVLDISHNPGQEGLHRMMIAGDLFGWDTKFPVLLVETYDKARQERIEKDVAQREFNNDIEKALNYLDGWDFYSTEEFCEMLNERLEHYGLEDCILTIQGSGNVLEISKYDDDIDDTLIYNYNLNNVKIYELQEDESDDEDLEEIDLSKYEYDDEDEEE